MVKFLKLCFESLHDDTDRRCRVEISLHFSDGKSGEIARYLPDKNNKISTPSQTAATGLIAPKICQSQPPTFGSNFSRFYSNRITFGGVIGKPNT